MSNKAKLIIEVDADTGARQIEKVARAQEKVSRAINDTGKEARQMERAISAASREINAAETNNNSLIKSLAQFAGVSIGLNAVKSAITQIVQEMKTLGAETNATQKAFIQLSTVVNPANLGPDTAKWAQWEGTKYQVSAPQAAGITQTMISTYGMDQGKVATTEAMQLMLLGATQEGAQNVLAFGAEGGLTPTQSGALAQYAAKKSNRDLTVVADAFQALPRIGDPIEGAAAIAAMAGSVTPGELQTFVGRAGEALWDPESKLVKNMSSKASAYGADWSSLPMGQKLAFIKQNVGVTPEQIARGGANKEQARSLSALVRNIDKYNTLESEMRGLDYDFTDVEVESLYANNPQIASSLRAGTYSLQEQYYRAHGPAGLKSQEFAERSAYRRMDTARKGYGPYSTWGLNAIADTNDVVATTMFEPVIDSFVNPIRELTTAIKSTSSASGLALGGGHGGTP
jgi:hypothetical protein